MANILLKLVVLIGLMALCGTEARGHVRLPKVVVPPYKMFMENAKLLCPFELGNDRLYAVKWYKDNEEFFRYIPRYKPPIHVHKVEGISVVMEGSDQKFVTIGPLDLRSTGVYRCEVSAEGPSFASVSGEGRMTVVHLPKEGPQINGQILDEYETGDNLALNCTSAYSFPPARLSWYINDMLVEHGMKQIKPRYRSLIHPLRLQLEKSVSSINITLGPEHFNDNGEAKVRCVASISTLFWQDRDERIVGNSRKLTSDFTFSSANNFNSVASPPVFQDDREASLLVRGESSHTTFSMWTVMAGLLCRAFLCKFLTHTYTNENQTDRKRAAGISFSDYYG